MAEFIYKGEETISIGEPIIFENKTEVNFDVSVGVVFRKSGLYRVSVYGNNVSVQKEPERMRGKWIKKGTRNFLGFINNRIYECSNCGNLLDFEGVNAGRGDANYCPNCGAYMRDE